MMAEVLPPGVKHREKPDLRTEMSPLGSNGPQSLGGRVEQDIVDRAGILEGDRGDLVGNGEDNMEILRVEKLRPPSLDPFRPGERLALGATARTAACMRPSKSSAYFKARSTFFLNFIAVSLFDLKARFSAPTHMSRELARAGGCQGWPSLRQRHEHQRFQAIP